MKRSIFSVAIIAALMANSVIQANPSAIQSNNTGQSTTVSTENMQKGQAFLAQNKKASDVHVLPNGLQYKVIKNGRGEKPGPHDTVTLEFAGYLLNGKLFQATKGPTTYPLHVFIPGLKQALLLMRPGAKWKVYIPSELGYGKSGNTNVGPNEVLALNVHLIGVKKS